MVVGDSFFSPGGPSRVVAAGSRPDHPEARGRSKSQERGGPGPHAKPDGQILVFWIIAFKLVVKRKASLLFHKLVSDKRLSCCAVESSMSEIRARRARQLQQIASLVGLTEKFRPAAR